MSFGVPAALLLYIAGGFGLDGQATLELRGGHAPLTADNNPRWGVTGTVTPDVQLWYLSRRLDLRLDYGLRVFWRQPNDGITGEPNEQGQTTTRSSNAPLLLHVGTLRLAGRASRRVRMTGDANVSYGEADYTAVSVLLGPGQAALPPGAKLDILSVTAGGGAQVDLSRLSVFNLTALFTYRRPTGLLAQLQPDQTTGMFRFPRVTSIAVTPGVSLTLTRQGALTLASPISYGSYADGLGTTVFLIAPQAGWLARLSPRTTLHVGGGVNYLRIKPDVDDLSPFSPVGDVTLESLIPKREGLETRVSSAIRLDYYFDPVTGRPGPRLTLATSAFSAMTTDWLIGVDAGYSTVFSKPLTAEQKAMNVNAPDETAVYANFPIRHRMSSNLLLEFGLRLANRGPSPRNDLYGFHQHQIWLYVMLTGTTRPMTNRMVQ